MAAANTYVSIATQTLGSAAASVTFSSISGSYTDLVLILNASGSTGINVLMQFNGDTGTNYSSTTLGGSGTTAYSARYSNQTSIEINYEGYLDSGFNTNSIINIQNYSNSTTYKTTLDRFNNAGLGVDAVVGLWRNTAPITSVVLKTHTGTFATGSTFSLYGILAA
jgi:hypothetical protein